MSSNGVDQIASSDDADCNSDGIQPSTAVCADGIKKDDSAICLKHSDDEPDDRKPSSEDQSLIDLRASAARICRKAELEPWDTCSLLDTRAFLKMVEKAHNAQRSYQRSSQRDLTLREKS